MENTDQLLEEPSVITPSDIAGMKVPDLRRELKLRGLTTSGNKGELVTRLQSAIAKGFESLESADDVNEDEVLGDVNLLSGDDVKVQEVSEDEILGSGNAKELEASLGLLEAKTKPLPSIKANSTHVRIQSNVTTTPSSEPDAKPEVVLPTDASKENDSNVIKIRKMSAEERLSTRAQRFNHPLTITSESKLKLRSERFGITSKPSLPVLKGKMPITKTHPTDVEKLKQRAERFGQTVSTGLKQVEDKEKLLKRKQRFGSITSTSLVTKTSSDDDKKRRRAERFGI